MNQSQEQITQSQNAARVEELEKALESLSKHRLWLVCIFLLSCTPGVFNGWHIMVSNFYAFTPTHWCQVPELADANWTTEQIKKVSMPKPFGEDDSSCTMISWNYTHLSELGFDKAMMFINSSQAPEEIPCDKFSFDDKEPYSSVVTEWNLVCDHKIGKTNVQASIATGKLFGGFLFGFIGDRFGRKISFVISCAIYMTIGPIAAFVPTFWLFIAARFMLGVATVGCYENGFTILAELVSSKWRTILGCIYNCSYPIGYITLVVATLALSSWRDVQLAISLPVFFLLVNCWFIPESPRWLATRGLFTKAWKIISTVDKSLVPGNPLTDVDQNNAERYPSSTSSEKHKRSSTTLFSSGELMKRVLLCYLSWFIAGLTYYVLALNSDNFGTDKHMYILLSGLVEIPGYILPIFILLFLGRKLATAILFFISGATLVAISGISKEHESLILMMAMLGRFSCVAVFAVVIVYTAELFPTTTRNSALGSSLAVSQFGSVCAPYVVDFLSAFGWYVPSTLCGCAALICSALILMLPETKGRSLQQTVDEVEMSGDRVALYNCCKIW